jgi:hypothetical protein
MRRYQLHLMPKPPELTAPVVRRATGFYIDHCLGVIADGFPHLLWTYGSIYQCLTVLAKDGNLEDVFGQIDRNGGSIVLGMGSSGCGDLPL